MKIAQLIIDFLSGVLVPIAIPFIVYFLGKKPVKHLINTRIDNIENTIKENAKGCGAEEYQFIEKVLNETFSKPFMRWNK